MKTYPRRNVLKALGRASLLALLPGSARLAAQPGALDTTQLGAGLFVVYGPDANALVLESREGSILVDGGSAAWSPALLARVRESGGGRPVRALINTHWHPEQTGSNLELGAQGVEIIAHDNTRLWLGTTIEQRWSGETFAPLPEAARPTVSVFDGAEKVFGERRLQLGYLLHAHTDGDLFVHLPAENLLFAGGFLGNDRWPLIDWWTGGWTGGMLNAFDSVLPLCNDATLIVPAAGPVMRLQELKDQREMYLAIFDKVHKAFTQSLGPDETVAAKPAAGFKPEWGAADLFVKLAAQSLQGHLRSGVGNWLPRIP